MNDFTLLPSRAATRERFIGPRVRVRSTGEYRVWNGERYVPEGSMAALPQADQQDLSAARGQLGVSRRNSHLAEQFFRANQTPRRSAFDAGGETGGTAALPVPAWTGLQNPTRQLMEGLNSSMLRANIREGTSGTLNSMFEQILARQQYPGTDTAGSTNAERVINMMVDNEEMTTLLDEAEQWSRQHQGLHGFDVHWTRERSGPVREAARQRAIERLRGPVPGRQGLTGVGAPVRQGPPAAAPSAQPTQGGVTRWERGPDGRPRAAR